VKPALESAIRSIGPYVIYPDGTVTDRATGLVLWRPGDPGEPPHNPEPKLSNKPHNTQRGVW
jgi:hypothetical protein